MNHATENAIARIVTSVTMRLELELSTTEDDEHKALMNECYDAFFELQELAIPERQDSAVFSESEVIFIDSIIEKLEQAKLTGDAKQAISSLVSVGEAVEQLLRNARHKAADEFDSDR